MYRDEISAFRERYDAARGSVRAAWRQVEEQRELLEALRAQLTERGLAFPGTPKVDPARSFVDAPPDSKAVDLVRLADAAEKEAARLVAHGESLARLATLLNRRLQGEAVVLPLGPPPRSVPWTYVVAELATWLLIVPLAVAAAVAASETFSSPSGLPFFSAVFPAAMVLLGAFVPFGFRAGMRARFLGRCVDAASTNVVESGSDGSKMTNWPVRVSKGWEVSVESYTGAGRRDVVEFLTQDGRRGTVTVTGAGYHSGVVLYDPATMQAYDVKQLACSPQPDVEGRWTGKLSRRSWLKILLFLVALLSVVALGAASLVAALV